MTPEQFAVRRRALTQRLLDALIRLFLQPGSWRAQDADRFVELAVPMVQASQRTLAALTSAYLAQQAAAAVGGTVTPPGVLDRFAVDLRRGVTAQEVYRRPYTMLYTALSRGQDMSRALAVAQSRLREVAEMDLQQTYATASQQVLRSLPARARPSAWRRVLTGLESCALCVVASTQRYRLSTLDPIHPGCDCIVEPIYGPAGDQVIDEALLEQVHAAVTSLTGRSDRGGRAPDYRKITVEMTREHGELGPLLVRPLDKFTGPGAIPAS